MDMLIQHADQLVILAAIAIVFLQSSIDKLVDWKGNKEFLSGHFANSPLKGTVPLLLPVITLIEFTAGVLGAYYLVDAMLQGSVSAQAIYACVVAAVALLMLLFGQRVAKDYAGAQTLVIYLILIILGIGLFR